MTPGAKILSVVVIAGAGVGAWWLVTPACACMTPDRAAHVFLRHDIGQVFDAQQAYFGTHHRYARSLEALDSSGLNYPPIGLRLEAASDSSVRIVGESAKWPGVTCKATMTPGAKQLGPLDCTGRAH